MRDGKGKFFKTLNLDKQTKKLIRWYRQLKPLILKGIDDRKTVGRRN